MTNNKMKIKVQLVKNVDDLIVGKNNLLISFFCYITNSLRPRRNTNASQSGAENEERM
jgi:hypothetical protein